MNLFHNIFNRTAVAVTAICCALLCSCEKEQPAKMEVSAKSELLSATMNLSTFISVKCEGSWTLSLEYDDQSDDWAKLDVTSGTGSKNGIMLTLSQNSSEARRSVCISHTRFFSIFYHSYFCHSFWLILLTHFSPPFTR